MTLKDIETFSTAFETRLTQFGTTLQRANVAGLPEPAWEALKTLLRPVGRFGGQLRQLLNDLAGSLPQLPGFIAEQFTMLTEMLGDEFDALLDLVGTTAGGALDIAIGAVLAVIEMIKKTIYLITDFIRKSFGDNPLIDAIHLQLDLIDNLLGNMMELLSPKLGAKARRLRLDMYGQLTAIRAAQGAFAPIRIEDPGEPAI